MIKEKRKKQTYTDLYNFYYSKNVDVTNKTSQSLYTE